MTAHDARRVADRAARLAAQTGFGAPLVLEAGAGTGKTTVLVARVLAWCLGPGWDRAECELAAARPANPAPREIAERALERVVAITFTEAAAAEMETRTMKALAQVAEGAAVCGYDGADTPTRRDRARTLLGAFDRLHVQTIHAFCRRLLASHPLEAGLHPRFSVDARGSERSKAAREAIEARLRAMAERGDPDLEELLLHGMGAPELAEMLDALLAAAVPARAFAADPLAPERIREFAVRLRETVTALSAAIGDRFDRLAKTSVAKAIAAALDETRTQLRSDVASRLDLAALVAHLAERWPQRLERLGEWGRGKWKDSDRAAVGDVIDSVQVAARALHPLLRHALALDLERLALVHRVIAPLLDAAERKLHEVGAESFDALLRKTRDLLVAHPGVAERVRREIDQLLVDEFQDTDAMQCEIVAALALGGDASTRPGLFLVGDPKQSIYGFRNADIGAYMDFVAKVLAEPDATRHSLCVNYRSVPAVLDEVERVVRDAMVFEPRVQPAFESLLPCEEQAGVVGSGTPELPAVEYWVSAAWDADAGALAEKTSVQHAAQLEASHVARDLSRLHESEVVRWKDVALLFRSTGDLDVYLSELRRAGIPYNVDRDREYYRRRVVFEASALVRAALDPSDQLAQVAVLRAPWVGVPDAAWPTLWAQEFPRALRKALDGHVGARDRLREIAAAAARETAAKDVPGLDALAGWEANLLHAIDVVVALRRSWQGEPVDHFIEKLRVLPLLEATEAARYPGAFGLANLARFFRELAVALETGDAATVLRALRRDAEGTAESYEGRPQDAAEDAVQVMTIHGAKGLDFRHVYVLQLHKTDGGARVARHLHEQVGGHLEWQLDMARKKAIASLGYDRVRARREAIEDAELVRTLYVALTRAKSRLVLAGCFDAKQRPGTHAGFVLGARGGALVDAGSQVAAALAADAATPECAELEGARAVFLSATRDSTVAEREAPTAAVVAPARVQADALRLALERRSAALRQCRSFGGRASEKVPEAFREWRADGCDAERDEGVRSVHREGAALETEVATAIGTAIHALLERFDWNAEPLAEWERQRSQLFDSLARRVAPLRLDGARERAQRLLERLAGGSLWARLRELAPHVIAREIPVLVRSDADGTGAVGYVVGAVDLVYLDRARGDVVVADFKTDRVATPRDIATRVQHHRAQAELYRRALHETLRLPRAPRVELWFLDASHVEVLEFEAAPGEAGVSAIRPSAD